MDNYKSLLMETISKEDLVSKPAKIKRAGKLKEDLLPDEVYDTLVRKSKKTYTVGVYSTLPGPGWHYEINTEYGVYAKVPDDEGFIAHWFIQGKPQPSVEKMEDMAHYLIDEYDCKEVSLDEYKRIVNGKDGSLTEDTVKTSDGKWTNKGREGTHGKFKTKKEADAQRKAMFANNFKESLEDTKGKEMTALVRLPDGNLKVMHDDWFKNQKDFAEELRANGFKVLKVWYGYKSDAEADEWEMLHRKTNESLYGSKSLKEAKLGPYKYRYETHWINGRDVLLGANKTRDGAENIAYNQIENILGNPWEDDRNKYKIIDSLYIYDSENDEDVMSMELEDYIDSILSELDSRIKSKKESLTERYADDAVILIAPLRKKLNKICQKYSGFHLPQEIAPMWKELYDLGIEVLIQGYPTDTAPGAKSWTVPFTLNGETVDNSRFVYSVYEGSEGLKNDYNMYFS